MTPITSNGMASGSADPTRIRRILVVDDHPVVRRGLCQIINRESDLEVCGEAAGLADAMQIFLQEHPDLVVSDLSLNDGSGLDLIKEIVSQDPNARVLVQSVHDEVLYAERVLRAGARGYLNKSEAVDGIVDAIRRVLAGHVSLSKNMTDRMLYRTVAGNGARADSSIDSLSDRELEVFEQIGRGRTTRQIAQNLYLSPKTIETYRENIKSKLNLRNATELTQHAVQWVLESNGHIAGPLDGNGPIARNEASRPMRS